MFEKSCETILKNALQDAVPEIIIDSSIYASITGSLKKIDAGKQWLLVADTNTWQVAGEKIKQQLDSNFNILPLIFEETVKPDEHHVNQLMEALAQANAVLAVGSGTINDICKLASFRTQKPYAISATAPSMNGYTSANASILINGHKQSMPAQLPHAVFADIDILANAPLRLIRAGLGDSLARSTAQADWLLSHLVLGTSYDSRSFELTAPYEAGLLKSSAGLVSGDTNAITLLTKTLLLSGFGMTIAGGSMPASQGEHMIAHVMEMKHEDTLPHTYHGEQIGVTTLTMARMQEELLNSTPCFSMPDNYLNQITTYFGSDLAHDMQVTYEKKRQQLTARNLHNNIKISHWKKIQNNLKNISVPASVIKQALHSVSSPLTPADLGWSEEYYTQAIAHAKYSRDRFTFLDITPAPAG